VIARCIHNTGAALGVPLRSAFHTAESTFHLSVGTDYAILGLGLFEGTLLALVLDETGKPNWLPVGLFDLADAEMPEEWHFSVVDPGAASGVAPANGWMALWGYAELVQNQVHREKLIERDGEALEVFFREVAREQRSGN
jgi:hypothetical protein